MYNRFRDPTIVILRWIRDWYALRRFSLPAFVTWVLHICTRFRWNSYS